MQFAKVRDGHKLEDVKEKYAATDPFDNLISNKLPVTGPSIISREENNFAEIAQTTEDKRIPARNVENDELSYIKSQT